MMAMALIVINLFGGALPKPPPPSRRRQWAGPYQLIHVNLGSVSAKEALSPKEVEGTALTRSALVY
jgi:hypothetical protein